MQFYQLAPGARFEFRGRQFVKTAISMALDSERVGTIFQHATEVTPIGEPLLLPEAEAQKWDPLMGGGEIATRIKHSHWPF